MSISAVYYRKADGVIFVFDMTRPRSFTDIVSVWMNAVEAQERYVHKLSASKAIINKSDVGMPWKQNGHPCKVIISKYKQARSNRRKMFLMIF